MCFDSAFFLKMHINNRFREEEENNPETRYKMVCNLEITIYKYRNFAPYVQN